MTLLETILFDNIMLAALGTSPGPIHSKSGVPLTPLSNVVEHSRVTISPADTFVEGEAVRERVPV